MAPSVGANDLWPFPLTPSPGRRAVAPLAVWLHVVSHLDLENPLNLNYYL
jgi:hypothetical protein